MKGDAFWLLKTSRCQIQSFSYLSVSFREDSYSVVTTDWEKSLWSCLFLMKMPCYGLQVRLCKVLNLLWPCCAHLSYVPSPSVSTAEVCNTDTICKYHVHLSHENLPFGCRWRWMALEKPAFPPTTWCPEPGADTQLLKLTYVSAHWNPMLNLHKVGKAQLPEDPRPRCKSWEHAQANPLMPKKTGYVPPYSFLSDMTSYALVNVLETDTPWTPQLMPSPKASIWHPNLQLWLL